MNDIYAQALGRLDGGLVLDAATGEGGFAGLLAARLHSCRRIVGIDTNTPALLAAKENPDLAEHAFARIEAERLAFRDAAFDAAAIAFSLHHLERPARVLVEMMRVLKPGGHLVVAEMHASARTVPQRTAVQIHQWAASVDTTLGLTHFATFPRQRFVDWIEALPLGSVEFHDWYDSGANPFEPQFTTQVQGYINNYLERASETSDYPLLARQAADLRERMRAEGIQPEPILLLVARKLP